MEAHAINTENQKKSEIVSQKKSDDIWKAQLDLREKIEVVETESKRLKTEPLWTAHASGQRKCFTTRGDAFEWICDSLECGMEEDFPNKWTVENFECTIQKFERSEFENSQEDEGNGEEESDR